MPLRDYQQKAIDMLYDWFETHKGNPCVEIPTAGGKSHIIAGFCQKAIKDYPETRIIIATHQKELIEQDYEKIKALLPNDMIGLYSASIGIKQTDKQITFAGIQSVYNHYSEFGIIDLIIVDEAHLINANDTGMYRKFFNGLIQKNPYLKVIGFTATPYRLGHGMITDKPAIFNEPIIKPTSIRELQDRGYLSRIVSKCTNEKLDVTGVKTTAGDYNKKELVEAVDIPGKSEAVVNETIKRAGNRKSWLFFCCSIEHAIHVRDILRDKGVTAEEVDGSTPKEEREQILNDFKSGKITAITNVEVLTTGFDNPKIDLIVLMRPTKSPGRYVQTVGRGLRIAEGKANCLVLDFAGNILYHGAITDVNPPTMKKESKGIAPCKVCPECDEILPIQAKVCTECGHIFPISEQNEKEYQLSDADISGRLPTDIGIRDWRWHIATSKAGNKMIRITYYPANITKTPISEYLCIWADNDYAKSMARNRMSLLLESSGTVISKLTTGDYICNQVNTFSKRPKQIQTTKQDKYIKVINTIF